MFLCITAALLQEALVYAGDSEGYGSNQLWKFCNAVKLLFLKSVRAHAHTRQRATFPVILRNTIHFETGSLICLELIS